MRPRNLTLLLLLMFALTGQIASAQVPGTPTMCASGVLLGADPKELDEIARKYFAGDSKVTDDARRILKKFKAAPPEDAKQRATSEACGLPNYDKDVVSVVFFSKARAADGEVIRFFLADPFGSHLHGVKEFWEVFLAPTPDGELRTSYVSTRKPNPILEQLPTALKTFKWESLIPLTLSIHEAKPEPFIAAQVSKLVLPYTRATIAIKDDAVVPAELSKTIREALKKKSTEVRASQAGWQARVSPCAKEMNDQLDLIFRTKLGEVPDGAPAALQWKGVRDAVDVSAADVLASPKCAISEPPTDLQIAQQAAAKQVYDAYVAIATPPTPAKGTGTWTYENVPWERFGLTGLAGAITSPDNTDRVKLNGTVLQKDPMNSVLAAIAVDIHFRRFDPKAEKPSAAERWRAFVGLSFTPEFGVVGGVGYGVLRNLSVNVGMGGLRINALRSGDTLGAAPADAAKPFHEKIEAVGFFALGFNF